MYDIIIIGSGPAGLTAAIYASRAGLRAVVVEKDTMGAGQISVTEQVDNYPGLPHIGGYELGRRSGNTHRAWVPASVKMKWRPLLRMQRAFTLR